MNIGDAVDLLGPDSSVEDRINAVNLLRQQMMVVQVQQDEDHEISKIIVDYDRLSAEQMIERYQTFLATWDTLPFDPEGKHIRLYKGQWSILSGFPGVGKTTMLKQMVAHLLWRGAGVFVFSGEDDPEHYLIELAGVAFGVEVPSVSQLQAFIAAYGGKLFIWGRVEINSHKAILSTISALARDGKIQHAIVDSLTTLDIPMDDYEKQRQIANLIRVTAIARGVHIHLVAHPRKPMAADATPRLEDVAGSADLGRLAFNGYFLRRGPEAGGREGIYSSVLVSLKQRTRGWTGELAGYFYSAYRQFHLSTDSRECLQYMSPEFYKPAGIDFEPFKADAYVDRSETSKPGWEL